VATTARPSIGQAKELKPEVIRGQGFLAVRQRFRFTQGAAGLKAGSRWEQILVFQPSRRYVLSSERITSVKYGERVLPHRHAWAYPPPERRYVVPAAAFARILGPMPSTFIREKTTRFQNG
jgi:hypothetical protein